MKYKKKPIIVEAEQFNPSGSAVTAAVPYQTGDMFMEFPVWCDGNGYHLRLPTANGESRVDAGDWVLTDPNTNDKWPVKPDIFAATYEPAEL